MAETKKNPDYIASAENLCNPPEVLELLLAQRKLKAGMEKLTKILEGRNPHLIKAISVTAQQIADLHDQLKEAIDLFGSYQDVDAGYYALKYRKVSKRYHPEPFIEKFEKFVPAVIENSVNAKALEGLIKGKLVTEDELKDAGVISEKIDHSFFVR